MSERPREIRVMITGAAGFLGSHVSDLLVNHGWGVVGIDAFTPFYPRARKEANIASLLEHSAFRIHEVDLLSDPLDDLLRGVDAVCHLAGQPGVRGRDAHKFETQNVVATHRLFSAAVQCSGDVPLPRIDGAPGLSLGVGFARRYGYLARRSPPRSRDQRARRVLRRRASIDRSCSMMALPWEAIVPCCDALAVSASRNR